MNNNNNNPKTTTRTYSTTGYAPRSKLRKKHNRKKFIFFVILTVLLLAVIIAISAVIVDIIGGIVSDTSDQSDGPSVSTGHGMSQAYDGDLSTYMLSVTKQSIGSYFSCEFASPCEVGGILFASSEADYYIRSAVIQLKVNGEWITIDKFEVIGERNYIVGDDVGAASAVRVVLTTQADELWAVNELGVTDRSGNRVELRSPAAGTNSGFLGPIGPDNTDEETTMPIPPSTTLVSYNNDKVYTGSLILVNAQYVYHFPAFTANLLNLYNEYYANDYHCNYFEGSNIMLEAEATRNLFAMLNAMKSEIGLNNIILGTGYRTYDEQKDIADKFPATAALPGYSEHHTGLGIDMRGWIDGIYVDFDEPNSITNQIYSWINANAYKYGYVRRFAPDKDALTGISTDRWHYRYVGVPHAYYMTANNLCLEEYLATLEANCKYGSNHLIIEGVEGKNYEIYFVPAKNGETTDIPVPADPTTYTVSGNNYSGYIVTITRN